MVPLPLLRGDAGGALLLLDPRARSLGLLRLAGLLAALLRLALLPSLSLPLLSLALLRLATLALLPLLGLAL